MVGKRRSLGGAICSVVVATILATIALGLFLVAQLAALRYGILYQLWTPFIIGDLVLIIGGLAGAQSLSRHRSWERALGHGSLVTAILYGVFLAITVGLIAANTSAVQLPGRLGAVYRYDPRTREPDSTVLAARPEMVLITHLESERTFPLDVRPFCDISGGGANGLVFCPGAILYRVVSYEVGTVLIRRVPNEPWWDDDPTFIASIDLHIEFVTGDGKDFRVELVSGCSRGCDPLGLLAQGYLTPTFWGWRPDVLRPR